MGDPITLIFNILGVMSFLGFVTLFFRCRVLENEVEQLHRAHHADSDHMRNQDIRDEWNAAARELRRKVDQEMNARKEYFTVWTREHEVRGHANVD